jgi:hypothetical protein
MTLASVILQARQIICCAFLSKPQAMIEWKSGLWPSSAPLVSGCLTQAGYWAAEDVQFSVCKPAT